MMFRIGVLIWIISTFALDPRFYDLHATPKLIFTVIFALIALCAVAFRQRIRLPLVPELGLAWVVLMIMAILQMSVGEARISFAPLFIGPAIVLWASQLDSIDQDRLRKVVIWTAAIHCLLLGTQFTVPHFWEALDLGFVRQRSSGLVGNREFFSTLVGVAVIFVCPTIADFRRLRRSHQLLMLAMLASLFLVQSKGTLILLGLIWTVPSLRRRGVRIAFSGFFLMIGFFLLIMLQTVSFRSRLLLWAVAAHMGLSQPVLGVGFGQFGNGYFFSLEKIFSSHPGWAQSFGDLAGVVDDAHGILFTWFAEGGVVGLIAALLLILCIVRLARTTARNYGTPVALFFLGKLLYTVVIGASTSLGIFAITIGLVARTREFDLGRLIRASVNGLAIFFAAVVLRELGIRAAAEWNYSAGYRALNSRDFAEAERRFSLALDHDPFFSEAWLGKGLTATEGRPPRDPELFLKAALASKTDFNTMKIAARTYFVAGDCWNSERLYERIHTAFPEHLTSLAHLAICEKRLGRENRAKAYAAKLLRTQPRVPTRSYARNLLRAEAILGQNFEESDLY